VYVIMRVYSMALRAMWWIRVNVKCPANYQAPPQFILSANHISFLGERACG
jgi:hypothetical protein